jgi:cytoskeletal protein CcmA (bactofilin family)
MKSGTENVHIVVTRDMTVTASAVGKYEPFDAYDLLLRHNADLYIPEGITLTIGEGTNGTDVTFRISGALVIDGNLEVRSSFWVGGKLTVNGALYVNLLALNKYATIDGAAESIKDISLPEKSYDYHMSFRYDSDNDIFTDGEIYYASAETEQQLRDIIADNVRTVNVDGKFDITEPITPNIWVVTDEAKLTIKSDFTVQGTLNVAGELAGAEGGKVIIPADAQIRNVLWGGGWLSEENGTGVLHGLPVDVANTERVYVWQDGAWVLTAGN